jgi:large subunit ribosomal protein L29
MKQKDIAQLTPTELNTQLAELNAQLVKMHLNHQISPIENPMKIRTTRRTIARIQTELTKRNTAAN